MMTSGRSFAAEFEPAVLGRRRAPRAPVSLDAKVGRGGLDRALCRVVDLSIHGAKIETFSALRRDAMIWLTLPHIGHWAARVAWAGDFEAGLEFQIPLTEDEFEKLAA
ncbi:PilZ domain-containing protein [Sphingomonas sp. MS122]|uniref:PilZ domain-containing protein n=1 Tax=Sphingomonas sp. MS122 TaxID=3412683 RepID=UPI003C2BEC6A